MESKRNLPLKILHLLLIAVGLLLCVVSLALSGSDEGQLTTMMYFSTAASAAALLAGFFYMTLGYKKDAASYYKIYMWVLVIAEALNAAMIGTVGYESALWAVLKSAVLVLFVVLAVGKDLGKTKSTVFALLLVAIQIGFVAWSIVTISDPHKSNAMFILCDNVCQLILAGTTGLMVCAKYLDKTARGTN